MNTMLKSVRNTKSTPGVIDSKPNGKGISCSEKGLNAEPKKFHWGVGKSLRNLLKQRSKAVDNCGDGHLKGLDK